jgi:hypothetical protein
MRFAGLRTVVRSHELRIQNQMQVLSGGEALARQSGTSASQESLTVSVSGTVHPVFVFGVDDPDDTTTLWYIP